MRNIKLILAYDGTNYFGWQSQKNVSLPHKQSTVQAEIEAALHRIHSHPVKIIGSGRTDSGVHAAGQAANFHTDIESMKPESFVPALNSILPKDIRILKAEEVSPNFNARFDACKRTYRYFFISGRQLLPHEYRYAVYIRNFPPLELLNSYSRILTGECDCTIFSCAGDKSLSRTRYIYNAIFFPQNDKVIFEISANAFLWKMVRSIAGTFIHYGRQGISPQQMREIIGSKNRSLAGPTLPPNGLFLWDVKFYR